MYTILSLISLWQLATRPPFLAFQCVYYWECAATPVTFFCQDLIPPCISFWNHPEIRLLTGSIRWWLSGGWKVTRRWIFLGQWCGAGSVTRGGSIELRVDWWAVRLEDFAVMSPFDMVNWSAGRLQLSPVWRDLASTLMQEVDASNLREEEVVEIRRTMPASLMGRDRRVWKLSGMTVDISNKMGIKWWWVAFSNDSKVWSTLPRTCCRYIHLHCS